MNRLNVLISAYACEPGRGSEPGVGWHVACTMARHHDVTVLTRAKARPDIEAALSKNPIPGLQFVYFDYPRWARWWKRGPRGIRLYYYLWQIAAYSIAREMIRTRHFDLVHHVTFVKYWTPSFLSLLPPPFLWGPVGGAETAPASFLNDHPFQGKLYEVVRDSARWLSEYDPFVRATAQRSSYALATTVETADRLQTLGAKKVMVMGESGLNASEIAYLGQLPDPPEAPIRFASLGRLLHWKGFHLGLRAFAQLDHKDAEYWIIGEGPEDKNLRALAQRLGIADRVTFFGRLPRELTLQHLSACHALVHPSLHDSGGWVCLEAMASGKPVLCLDIGGPSMQVTNETGYIVKAHDPEQVVSDLAGAMQRVATDPSERAAMSRAARKHVRKNFTWEEKGKRLSALYYEVAGKLPNPEQRPFPSSQHYAA